MANIIDAVFATLRCERAKSHTHTHPTGIDPRGTAMSAALPSQQTLLSKRSTFLKTISCQGGLESIAARQTAMPRIRSAFCVARNKQKRGTMRDVNGFPGNLVECK
jgi:hypothetical protein